MSEGAELIQAPLLVFLTEQFHGCFPIPQRSCSQPFQPICFLDLHGVIENYGGMLQTIHEGTTAHSNCFVVNVARSERRRLT